MRESGLNNSKSRVVLVRSKRVINSSKKLDLNLLQKMVAKGLTTLTFESDFRDAISHFYSKKDYIGIKVNCLGGKMVATHPELCITTLNLFEKAGFQKKRFIVWERSTQELQEVGFPVNYKGKDLLCFGTDARGVGYTTDLFAYKDVGSLFSRIITDYTNVQINIPILKDHALAGVTCAMKNYFGAIHNPNKYHDNGCNPFVADLNFMPQIRKQNKLIICDALRIQYNGGPAYHPQWSELYGGIILGSDPVAVDFVGYQIIEKIRKNHDLPTLEKSGRKPDYIFTAGDKEHNLGNIGQDKIDLVEINLG